MATQDETKQAVEDCLIRIVKEFRIVFAEFQTDAYTQGGYSSGKWTYNLSQRSVSLDYWFSSFSSRKEQVEITYPQDDNKEKLESDLREGASKVRQFVNQKKRMF